MESKGHVLSQHLAKNSQGEKVVVSVCSCGNWGAEIGPIGDDSLAQAILDGIKSFQVSHLRPKGLDHLHMTEERDAT